VEFRSLDDRGVLIIRVSGRLDGITSDALETEVRRRLQAGHARIVFDLAALEYISSAGLRVLMLAARELRGKGTLAVAAPMPQVKQILDIAAVPTFAKIYDSAAEAVETLNR
jgi:anti-sigma B factor antagonist